MKKITAALFAVVIFSSCSTTITLPGFEETVFVDYSLFCSNGIEVSDTDVPVGRTSLGQITEVVRFTRILKKERISQTSPNDDIMFPETKTILISSSNRDKDFKLLAKRIADIVTQKGGKGIAKMSVSVTNADPHPVFSVSGIIYR